MKKILSIIMIAALISSCCPGNQMHFAQRAKAKSVKVVPGQAIPFKKINGKYIVLTERPAQEDMITISVKKSQ